MAGLLDSDIARLLLTGPKRYYDYRDQQAGREEFQGLLGSLEQQGPPDPQQPQGGLLATRAPDQQFWLKAASIPGYKDIAGQQLGIESQVQGAMTRQRDQQQYEGSNLTYAQQLAEERQRQVAQWNYENKQEDMRRKWAGTGASMASGYASAASSNASAANSAVQRQVNEQQLEQEKHKTGLLDRPIFYSMPAEKQAEAQQKLSSYDRGVSGAMAVADWAKNRAAAAALPGFAGTSEAATMQQEWQLSIKPLVMEMLRTGVLQGEEEKMVQGLIGKPDDYVLTASQLNSIANITQKAEDVRQDAYKSYGLKAPMVSARDSAASRTLSRGKPSGDLKDVTSRPGTYSGKVDRSR